jgi:shikimate dehydrogenase
MPTPRSYKHPEHAADIQPWVANALDVSAWSGRQIAAIIGDAPSHYSKSPALWNAAFARLGMNAIYVPLDVDENHLGGLIGILKTCDCFLGANVTVPHKARIMAFLDDIDAGARRIQACNTLVRTSTGQLVGYNTDGEGFIESLQTPEPGQTQPFIESLPGMDVLLLGAGGSARAVAFVLSDLLAEGQLFICNRTLDPAVSLALELQKNGRNAMAITEGEVGQYAVKAGLIVNCTTKGQGGVRRLSDGRLTLLEAYSSLAPAHPLAITPADFENQTARQQWLHARQADIDTNNLASLELARLIPQNARFYDLIYHPEETVFLRHGRLTGHRTQNGRAMIVRQAAIALWHCICKAHLIEMGKHDSATYDAITDIMFATW